MDHHYTGSPRRKSVICCINPINWCRKPLLYHPSSYTNSGRSTERTVFKYLLLGKYCHFGLTSYNEATSVKNYLQIFVSSTLYATSMYKEVSNMQLDNHPPTWRYEHIPEKYVQIQCCCTEQPISKQQNFFTVMWLVVHNNNICSVHIFPGCGNESRRVQ